MAIERKGQAMPPDFGPPIDPSIKIYRKKKDELPSISFWGFFRFFCTEEVISPAIITGYPTTGKENRFRFLNEVFKGVSVSPWQFIFASTSRASKTTENLLTKVWHQTWKYEKTTRSFERTIQVYKTRPELALDGLKTNIAAMLESGQIDRRRSGITAFQLLGILCPGCLSGPNQPDAERSLAVLLLICLLGDSVVFEQPDMDVKEWLDRKRIPSGLLVFPSFTSLGLYHIEDAQIDTRLLPSIVCGEKKYSYKQEAGSPLRQIITEQQYQWIFLSGQSNDKGNSAVSGAGKTTSLRFLALEEQESNILWLPLAEIYDHHNVRTKPHILGNHIRSKLNMDLAELPENTLFLLDGLDELMDREQIERLSGDLYMLQHSGKFGLIVSSKLPWDQMPRIDVFYEWFNVWKMFQPCTLQTLSKDQISRVVPNDDPGDSLFRLNTPFLLSLYLSTATLPDDPWTTDLIKRWRAEELFHSRQLTDERLFYRSLIVQIIRWHEVAPGKNIQWEMDAFLLLHTMPAIACQMLRSESNDSALDLASATSIDRNFVKRTVDVTWRTTGPWLQLFPGYTPSTSGPQYTQLLQGLSYDKFLAGAVPSLFHGDWNGEDQYARPYFVNRSLRDNLAFLHIANVFLLAYNGALETTIENVETYGHTVELLPAEQLQKAVSFFDLIVPEGNLRSILRSGPNPTAGSPLSQFLAGQIGATICEAVSDIRKEKTISSDVWYAYMVSAFEKLEQHGDSELRRLIEKRFGLAYIYGQTVYARIFRSKGQFAQAELCAKQVLDFQSECSWIINSDGYSMKALILIEQVKLILNCAHNRPEEDQLSAQGDQLDLQFAFKLTEELEYLTLNPQSLSKILPLLSEEQRVLVPIFGMILTRAKLKWEAYNAHDFFHNVSLKFLCSASYLAKAYSVFAALSPGNSGMAYNLLGTMMGNDDEQLENNKSLPFFKKNPKLHLEIPGLAYEDRFAASFQIFLHIYNIRRGPQPYSARRLCELMLRRQVQLDEKNHPIQITAYEPFTDWELKFIEQASKRSLLNKGNSEAYWYARYLHEAAIQNKTTKDSDLRGSRAERALQTAWKKCSCDEKLLRLKNSDFAGVDFISMMIILEDLLMDHSKSKEIREMLYDQIFNYLRHFREKTLTPEYTTGVRTQYSDLHDCLSRIDRLKDSGDDFVVRHNMECYVFKI